LSQQFADMLLRFKLGYTIPMITARTAKACVDAWALGQGAGLGYSPKQRLSRFFDDSFYQEISNKSKTVGEKYALVKTEMENNLANQYWALEPGNQEQQDVTHQEVMDKLREARAKDEAWLMSQRQQVLSDSQKILVEYQSASNLTNPNSKKFKEDKCRLIKKHITSEITKILYLNAIEEPFFEIRDEENRGKYCSFIDVVKGRFMFRFAEHCLHTENPGFVAKLSFINQLTRNLQFYYQFYIEPETRFDLARYGAQNRNELIRKMRQHLSALRRDFEQIVPVLKLFIEIAKSIHKSIADNDFTFSHTKALLSKKENQNLIEKIRKTLFLKLFLKLRKELNIDQAGQPEKAYKIFEQFKKSNFDNRRIFLNAAYVKILHDLGLKLYEAGKLQKAIEVFAEIPARLSSADQSSVFNQRAPSISIKKEYDSSQYHLGLIKLKQVKELLKADQNVCETKLVVDMSDIKEQLEQSRNYFLNITENSNYYSQAQQKIVEIEKLAKRHEFDFEDVASLALSSLSS
jgi:hypothetical protein